MIAVDVGIYEGGSKDPITYYACIAIFSAETIYDIGTGLIQDVHLVNLYM